MFKFNIKLLNKKIFHRQIIDIYPLKGSLYKAVKKTIEVFFKINRLKQRSIAKSDGFFAGMVHNKKTVV